MASDEGGRDAPFADSPFVDAPFGAADYGNVIPIESARPPPKPPRFTVLGWSEIAGPLPELQYLVRELGMVAGSGAPHLLTGYGFSGKTVACQGCLAGTRFPPITISGTPMPISASDVNVSAAASPLCSLQSRG